MTNVLFVGDVVGSPGRECLKAVLPSLKEKYNTDFVIVNSENAAGGNGLTPQVAEELFSCGADVLTSGNHIWDKKEAYALLDSDRRVIRPLNFPSGVPGKGSGIYTARNGQQVAVANACGRVYSPSNLDCPFRALDAEVTHLQMTTLTIIVDFHAEATSEKVAMGYFLEGKVSAVLGTHTHVQTADETLLPGGTAYITDAGMTGCYEGVIGVDKEPIIKRFLTQLPAKHEPAKGKTQLCGVFCAIDQRGMTRSIERIQVRP